jgi:DNA anti-recombination protein RmuC
MEDSEVMDYLSRLSIWWFLAAWCALLFMQKGKKRHSTKMESEQRLAHQLAEIRSGQEEMKDLLARLEAKMEANQAKMDVKLKEMSEEVHSIRSELEETIEHRTQNVMTHVNHVTQSLQKEMIEGIENTQGDLETVKTSLDTRTKFLVESISDTRKGLHEELSLMFQVEGQTTKALTEANRREF